MSVLLKKNYIRPKDPEEDREWQDALMGVLLQTTRDTAGKLVRSFVDEGDGVGAWRALITRYGNDSPELMQAKQIELIQKVVDIRCKDRECVLETVHTFEYLFRELDKFECGFADAAKKLMVLVQMRAVAPDIYFAIASRTELTYDKTLAELKKLAALNKVVDRSCGGGGAPMGAFHTTTSKKWGKKAAQSEKCFWCQKTGHRIAETAQIEKQGSHVRKSQVARSLGTGTGEEVTGTQPRAPPRGPSSPFASMQK